MEQRVEQLEKEIKELRELLNNLIKSYLDHDSLVGGHYDKRKDSIYDTSSQTGQTFPKDIHK